MSAVFFAGGLQRIFQVETGFLVVRSDAEGLPEGGNGLVNLSKSNQGCPQLVAGFGVCGIDSQGLFIIFNGLIEAIQTIQGKA